MKRHTSAKETFDFSSLPYICQKRFAEICDARTLITFADINTTTRKLSKRCHYIKEAMIFDDKSDCYVKCYCSSKECCNRGTNLTHFNGKLEVLDVVKISYHKEKKEADLHYFQQLPISLNSNEKISILVHSIRFSVFKTLVNPRLKTFQFQGGMIFDCSLMEFIQYIKLLSRRVQQYKLEIYGAEVFFHVKDIALLLSSLRRRKVIGAFSATKNRVEIINNFTFFV